ncbi:MAG: hypothetical protein AAB503_01620 [Patescibacteria group bacterium]
MASPQIQKSLAVITILIVIGHALGLYASLYENIPYYDSPMHFLGGVWASLIIIAFWGRFFEPLNLERSFGNALKIAGIVLTIGLLWELFEFSLYSLHAQFGIGGYEAMELGDTLKDLVLDWLGGITVFLAFVKR